MSKHVLAFMVLDAAEESATRHVFTGLVLQIGGAADIDRLFVEAPRPERQPAETSFEHAHAQGRKPVEKSAADKRGDEPHRPPGVGGGATDKDILPQIQVTRIV